jgi:hypothetical protein
MASSSTYPGKYLQLNTSNTKQLNLVVKIEGVAGYFSIVPIYQKVVYGDPRLKYGLPGLKYGGLVVVPGVRPWIMWDSTVTISQKVEPEQGRGSVSTMTLKFIDYDGFVSQLISPGILLDEPLGNKLCTIMTGYTNSAFPDDYLKVFRGFISASTSGSGWVSLEFSDANIKNRQTICTGGVTETVSAVATTDSALNIGTTESFFTFVQDVNGNVDWALTEAVPICSLTGGSNVVTMIVGAPNFDIIGFDVAGTGIPVGTVVTTHTGPAYGSPSTFNISNNATVSSAGTTIDCVTTIGNLSSERTVRAWVKIDDEYMEYGPFSFVQGGSFIADLSTSSSPTVLTNVIIPPPTIGFAVGNLVTGLGIPDNTVITAIDPVLNTVTISNSVTVSINSSTVNVIPYAHVFRGTNYSRGTTVATHDVLTEVDNAVQLQGNVIDLILKIYLSGWGGPWITGVSCTALGTILEAGIAAPNSILFPVDVVEEYGLVVGDQIQVTNSSFSGNNGNCIITDIQNTNGNDSNRIVVTNKAFTLENPASAVTLAFRSQYDTLPIGCGLSNTPQDIDIQGFLDAKQTYFATGQFNMQLFITSPITGKDFIESEIFLPIGAYSITKQGKLSIAVTSPPLIGQKLIQLDETNVLTPQNITMTRALNNRRFYNLIQYSYDEDDQGDYLSQANLLDADSESLFNQTQSLPIQSTGLKTDLGAALIIASRGSALLNRFKDAAYQITLDCNWEAGSQIEVGDVVIVKDDDGKGGGTLQITNIQTGVRALGTQLFEVISRTLKPQSGNASLILLSSLGYSVGQRYATISPSSFVGIGSTTASVVIVDSYGPLYPGNEQKKYASLIGTTITVHAPDWSYEDSAVFTGFDPSNPYRMMLGSALGFTPAIGDIVDIAAYGTGTDPSFDKKAKLFYAFLDPSLAVVTGADQTHFTVSSGDAAQLNVGQPIIIHNADYSILSNEVLVLSVTGTAVVTAKPLGMVPDVGQVIDLVGFKDGGAPYRLV